MGYKAKVCIMSLSIGLFCNILTVHKEAHGFVWPIFDAVQNGGTLTELGTMATNVEEMVNQIKQNVETIVSTGENIITQAKYAKSALDKLSDQIDSIKEDIEETKKQIEDLSDEVQKDVQDKEGMSEETKQSVEDQIDQGATEEEIKETTAQAEKNLKACIEKIRTDIDTMYTTMIAKLENLKKDLEEIQSSENLSDKTKAKLEEIIKDIEKNKKDLKDKQEKNKTEDKTYDEKVLASAFLEYNLAISEYKSGKISREMLKSAGEKFESEIAKTSGNEKLTEFKEMLEKVLNYNIDELKETILNEESNSKEYSDEDENETSLLEDILLDFKNNPIENTEDLRKNEISRYVFNYNSENETIYLGAIYSKDGDKSFLLSKELFCKEMKKLDDIRKKDKFRKCVTKAKVEVTDDNKDPYSDELYAPYKEIGVYKHIVDDYQSANITNILKNKQFTVSWLGEDGTFENYKKNIKGVENINNSYAYIALIELQSPMLWSKIRRLDALDRNRATVSDFQLGKSLNLDEANNVKAGIKDGRYIAPNLFFKYCDKKIEDVINKENAEEQIAECLKVYANGLTIGYESKNSGGGNPEIIKKEWREKAINAYNDISFESLHRGAVNIYESSLDYNNPGDNEKAENIVSLQKGIEQNSSTRDAYAARAQINRYFGAQMLTIINADALDIQSMIVRNMRNLTYNYFGQGE